MTGLPITIVKEFTNELVPTLTKLVKTSISTGEFPFNLKEALIRYLLKKNGLSVIFKNFRPVSNLSYSSRLIEHAISSTADRIHKGIRYGGATTICLQISTQYRNSTLEGQGIYPSCKLKIRGNLSYYVISDGSI